MWLPALNGHHGISDYSIPITVFLCENIIILCQGLGKMKMDVEVNEDI